MKVRACFFVLRWYGLCVSLLPWRTPLCTNDVDQAVSDHRALRGALPARVRRVCALPKLGDFHRRQGWIYRTRRRRRGVAAGARTDTGCGRSASRHIGTGESLGWVSKPVVRGLRYVSKRRMLTAGR